MNVFKVVLALSLSAVLLTNCKAPGNREPANQRQYADRTVASVDTNSAADQLAELAGTLSTYWNEQGNIKNQTLKRFAASSKAYVKNYPGNPEYVLGLYQVYRQIIADRSTRFFMSDESNIQIQFNGSVLTVAQAYEKMDQLAAQISQASAGKETAALKAGSSVTFLRFFSNKIAAALMQLAQTDAANKDYVQLRNYFSRVQNQVAILSTIKDSQKLKQRVQQILNSADWKSYQALAKRTYVSLADSSEIEGSSSELEKAEAITIGHRALFVLFKNITGTRTVASAPEKFEYAYLPEDMIILEKTPHAPKLAAPKPRRVAADENMATVLIGNIPGQYLNLNKNEVVFGAIEIKNRVIVNIQALQFAELNSFVEQQKGKKVIQLVNAMGPAAVECESCRKEYDVIYPGFINLHNHTKQNNLPVWGQAKGQFYNRFEWRDWDSYTKSVSQNMNPWIQYGKPIECAAFRWSEMQAMINGTTYLQGPSVCVDKWGVKRVEDKDSYVSQKLALQAPTDILIPNDMVFVWQTLKPIIDTGKTYEEALAQVVQSYCPSLASSINSSNVNAPAGLKILTDQKKLEESCGKEPGKALPAKFVRYIYWVHSGIAGKKKYLKDPKASAVVAHLAEGNRTDSYNNKEYEVLKLLGLNLPHINFVHGVGILPKNFPELAANQMGLVWSPFSNLILYGETLDIKAAHEAGVVMSIGSDWLPTGSKGILEEVKLAAQYVDRNAGLGYKDIFTDEYLFKMMTENPARLINHASITNGESAVGRLEVGAMGSVVAATLMNANPFTNIVRHVTEKDMNLVVIDGQPIYGNKNYLDQAGLSYETISDLDTIVEDGPAFSFTDVEITENLTAAEKADRKLAAISKFASEVKIPVQAKCDFKTAKGFVNQDTLYFQAELSQFMKNTNLNIDRFVDIQKLLSANLLNQSLNKISKEGDRSYAVRYFPSLYSCNDEKHLTRFTNYVKANGDDELKRNIDTRSDIRKGLSGKGPAALAEMYK